MKAPGLESPNAGWLVGAICRLQANAPEWFCRRVALPKDGPCSFFGMMAFRAVGRVCGVVRDVKDIF